MNDRYMTTWHAGVAPSGRTTANRAWFARVSHAAFAAKGVLYLSVAALALRADVVTPHAETRVLLALLGICLFAASTYKVAEAFGHPDVARGGPDAVVTRVYRILAALVYGAFGVAAFEHVLHFGSEEEVHWTARFLDTPFGPELVTLAGVIAIAFGMQQLYRAGHADCLRSVHQPMTMWARRSWIASGFLAYGGRGIAFALIGIAVIRAATTFDPRLNPRGIPGALEQLEQSSSGFWVLDAFAIGMAAYGLFCLLGLARRYVPRDYRTSATSVG